MQSIQKDFGKEQIKGLNAIIARIKPADLRLIELYQIKLNKFT